MKNKKGFTLVELLAVIAILAIMVILALPNVLEMFNNAKKSAYTTETKNIFAAAEQAFVNDSLNSSGNRIYSYCGDDNCANNLKLNGGKDIYYYIEFDSSGKVVKYCTKNDSYQYMYDGEGLNKKDIENVESVPEVGEDGEILITPDGCEYGRLGRKITVCYYTSTNPEYVGSTQTKECYSKQSLSECFSGTGITPSCIYTSELSNPEPKAEFDACRATLTNSSSYNDILNCFKKSPNFEYCIKKSSGSASFREQAQSVCTGGVVDFRHTVLSTDAIKPNTEGCYSQVRYSICLDGESEVEVYDKKKKKKLRKKLKDVTYDDLILCWDFEKGEYTYAKPLWIMKPKEVVGYLELTFSDGSKLNVIGDHRIFSLDANKFVSCLKASESPVGMSTINEKGEVITLVKRKEINEPIVAHNVITDKCINHYANGILTSRGLNNLYPIKDMKFVKEEREVFTREELSEIPDEYFYGLNLGETPRTFMGSEEVTKAQLLLFIEKTINTKK